jgi:hypothetical protein
MNRHVAIAWLFGNRPFRRNRSRRPQAWTCGLHGVSDVLPTAGQPPTRLSSVLRRAAAADGCEPAAGKEKARRNAGLGKGGNARIGQKRRALHPSFLGANGAAPNPENLMTSSAAAIACSRVTVTRGRIGGRRFERHRLGGRGGADRADAVTGEHLPHRFVAPDLYSRGGGMLTQELEGMRAKMALGQGQNLAVHGDLIFARQTKVKVATMAAG